MAEQPDLRQGYVKVSLAVLAAELFGRGVAIERVLLTNEDVANGTITAIVSGHESLPIVALGEGINQVAAEVTHYHNGLRTTEFRAFEPMRN